MSRRKHRIFGGFLHSSVGKIVWRLQSFTSSLHRLHARKVNKFDKTANYDRRSTITEIAGTLGRLVEHASKLGGRTLIFGLSPNAVSASVAGRKSEAVVDHDKPLVRLLLADKQKQPDRFSHLCVSQSSLNALFGPLWFFLISRNKTAVTKAVFAGFHWMVWKIADRPTHISKKIHPNGTSSSVRYAGPIS